MKKLKHLLLIWIFSGSLDGFSQVTDTIGIVFFKWGDPKQIQSIDMSKMRGQPESNYKIEEIMKIKISTEEELIEVATEAIHLLSNLRQVTKLWNESHGYELRNRRKYYEENEITS